MREPVKFQGKIIGELDWARKIYFTPRNENHVFRKFGDGFGISCKVIDALMMKKIETVVVIFQEREALVAPLLSWVTRGEQWKDGEDEQLILPGKFFNMKRLVERQEVLG